MEGILLGVNLFVLRIVVELFVKLLMVCQSVYVQILV